MLEEPENHLHPGGIPQLLLRLRGRTSDRTRLTSGHGRQTLVTSHSPVTLAAALEQAPDSVVFLDTVTRFGEGGAPRRLTRVKKVADEGERGTFVTPLEVRKYLDPVGGSHVGRRYFNLALLTAGASDQWFLAPLINRQITELAQETSVDFDYSGVVAGDCFTAAPRDRVQQEVAELLHFFDVVLIHHDHNELGKDDALRGQFADDATRIVGLVPVRQTEAWMLADVCALREASPVSSASWEVPHDVEKVADPKALLKTAARRATECRKTFRSLGPGGRTRHARESARLPALAHGTPDSDGAVALAVTLRVEGTPVPPNRRQPARPATHTTRTPKGGHPTGVTALRTDQD
jgi:hypothetical protein